MPPEDNTISDSDLESVISHRSFDPTNRKIPKRKYVCSIGECKLSFRRLDHLDRHEFHHTGIKKYPCHFEDCDKKYLVISHLKRHIKYFHEKYHKPKDIKCRLESCPLKFSTIQIMDKHYEIIHKEKNVYNCKTCDQKFRRKNHLRRHEVVKHTGEYPFSCEKCSKNFIQESQLQRHICKVYQCEVCEEKFEKWSQLILHKKSKDHIKSFPCSNCNKTFNREAMLRIHEEIHKELTERQVIPCPHEGCSRFYSHAKNLKAHIRVQHEGKKFKCTFEGCNKELVTKQKLDLHLKAHENDPGKTIVKSMTSKQRSKRKDAGKKKQSYATKLSGIIVNPAVEKMIIDGKTDDITLSQPTDNFNFEKQMDDTDEQNESVTVIELSHQILAK